MTIFIPEWNRSTGAHVQIKRLFRKLDDDYVVRKCITDQPEAPDFFLQQAEHRWLALVLCEMPFEALDPSQLFGASQQQNFINLLLSLNAIDDSEHLGEQSIGKLVVMWNCDSDQSKSLWAHYGAQRGIRLMSKKTFLENGLEVLPKLLTPLSHDASQNVLGYYFPEAEIPGICTTRRHFARDNSAKTPRFFLDTQQEWASKLDLELPEEQTETTSDFSVRLVNGVAGSGKTLIAANRALILAKRFPGQQVLMLIHNVPVVKDLKHRLERAHGKLPDNLTIVTALAWIRQQWVNVFERTPLMPKSKNKVPGLIKHYRKDYPELKPSDDQMLDEFDFINENLIETEDSYLAVERAGQGFALRKEERVQVWSLFNRVISGLGKEQLRLWSSLSRDLCLKNQWDKLDTYHHILVDEAQFFAPTWFQLVKRTLEKSEGSLFLCADPNQGFLKSRLSWKRVGLDVAGKTKKLRKSYRTTQAILRAANQVLAEFTQTDPDDFLQPDFEGMEAGIAPLLVPSPSPQDSIEQACNEIAAHLDSHAIALSNMLVIHGQSIDKKLLMGALQERFGSAKVWDLNGKDAAQDLLDNLRVSSVDTATGLEASVVFLLGFERLLRDTVQTESVSVDDLEQNARKLYMAMTRAGQRLVLISSTPLPTRIAQLFVVASGE
ncbi:DNA helicase II [Pseudomonas sp. FW306-02-F02-AA]|uniref:DNA 3'-5' helicase II n=1 Tax=Pseudomonas fluorescens TaxID=294 RepID=A0A0N9W9F5_PSEFL|nr:MULTISPECIES: UvrD-helicase domain-containing protein [Pseudomonas]ALH99552.1 ATP-binding protein [Pseudomonas fluorescens]PMZ04648.1 DNA helicase II [Pseudomonas sp. FW306-02-F02-AB]PMZ07450.1 DNA helicase II [Pseudomonas sp. FW306-02-H06C]PMZ16628.1 DNA helicase II [Pseudomonas sp. FW306-02-F02-AA]PMZ19030.1 DNA helicase II [Pseudomonas sp. FW306-02-F08-AA]